MVTPVFITQIEEGEDSFLLEQIHSLNLKDTTSMSTMTTNTYFPVETTKLTIMASNKNMNGEVFPLEVYSTTAIGATSSTPDSFTPAPNPVDRSKFLKIDAYQAQQYHETSCNKNPNFLLAMAHDIINPKTGFPLTLDGEPFCSFHKENEYKVGSTHLISEISRRARLNPNWVGIRSGNNDQPQPKSWNRSKCLMWLSNNPIINVEDRWYIVDSITKLIQSVSSANQQRLTYDCKQPTKNNTVADSPLSNDLNFNENLIPDFSHVLQNSKPPYCHKQDKSIPKNKGLMDPGTFKLVIEHQKEYSVPLLNFTPDKVKLNQKKLWDNFWPKLKTTSRKKKRSVKFV